MSERQREHEFETRSESSSDRQQETIVETRHEPSGDRREEGWLRQAINQRH